MTQKARDPEASARLLELAQALRDRLQGNRKPLDRLQQQAAQESGIEDYMQSMRVNK